RVDARVQACEPEAVQQLRGVDVDPLARVHREIHGDNQRGGDVGDGIAADPQADDGASVGCAGQDAARADTGRSGTHAVGFNVRDVERGDPEEIERKTQIEVFDA